MVFWKWVHVAVLVAVVQSGIAQSALVEYPFTGDSPLPVNVSKGINVTDFQISSGSLNYGTVNAADWTGSGVPYVQGNSGWDSPDSTSGRYFHFTLTAHQTSLINVTDISFLHRATGAGPSAITVTVNGTVVSTENVPNSQTKTYSEPLSLTDEETVEVRIIGWDNGSRTTNGGGQFRLDDVVIEGEVITRPQVIDFENDGFWTSGSGSIASYETDHIYEDLGMTFTGGPALRETPGTQDGFDATYNNSDYAWRMQDNTNVDWTGTLNYEGTIYSFGFQVRRWSAGSDFDVSYSTDGGSNFTSVGTIDDAFLNNSSDWTNFFYQLPSPETVDVGDFVVRITANNGNERIMIDDFEYEFMPVQQGWRITALDQLFEVDFDQTAAGVNRDAFNGQGFSPLPASGQLNSGAWAQTGMSDGDVNFGDIKGVDDFARGIDNGAATTGGIYAFEVAPGNYALGIKPGGSDWTPGTLTLRVLNETEGTINDIHLAYTAYIFNNQGRSSNFNFEYSTDGNNFTQIADLDFTSVDQPSGVPEWKKNERTVGLSGLSWSDGEYLYLRWTGDDAGGSGSRDAFALDDIRLIAEPSGVNLSSISGNYESVTAGVDQSLSSDVAVERYLRVSASAQVEVQGGKALTVNKHIHNEGTVHLHNNAVLNQVDETDNNTGSGTYIVERNGTPDAMKYNGWSSPVPGVSVHDNGVFQNANACDVYAFDGGEQQWKYDYPVGYTANCAGNNHTFPSGDVLTGADGTMDPARGYFAAGESGAVRTFQGNGIYNGTMTYGLETGNNPGNVDWVDDNWNLVGNPYPSPISISDFLTENQSVLETVSVYIWGDDGSEGSDYDTADYIVANAVGVVTSTGGAGQTLTAGNIASCQGFFVHGTSAGGNLTFKNEMRTETDNSEFRSGDNEDISRFWLSLRDEEVRSRMLIGFMPDATEGFDKLYDAPKFHGQSALNLSGILPSGEEMMIMGRPRIFEGDTQVIPLFVQSETAGAKTLYIDSTQNINADIQMTLIDRFLQDTVDLKSEEFHFTFDSAGVDSGRFVLLMHHPVPTDDDPSFIMDQQSNPEEVTVYSSGDQLVHETENGRISSVVITDMSGRTVYSKQGLNTNKLEVPAGEFVPGIYLSRVQTQRHAVTVEKVMLNR